MRVAQESTVELEGMTVADVHIELFGRFVMSVSGDVVPAERWSRRHAALLVKLLALTSGRRLHREQVIDRLWPDDSLAEALPKLHKAAHFARRASGRNDAVVLGDEMVSLFPGVDVTVDVSTFEELARVAAAERDVATATRALRLYAGQLLPEDLYDDWVAQPREHLEHRRRDLLRLCGRWSELVELDPSDEPANLELMRAHAASGDRHAALRQFERLDRSLRRELGIGPGAEARELRDQLLAAAPTAPPTVRDDGLVGRQRELATIARVLAEANAGEARIVLVTGPAGIGKSTMLRSAQEAGNQRGWWVGHGAAAAIEGAWPYAPVIDALADLCRRHVSLLDGLADAHRVEIEGALAGTSAAWSGESSHQRLFVAAAELLRLAATTHGVLLTIDDLHDADEASIRLLHYLARTTTRERLVIVVAHRLAPSVGALASFREAVLGRQNGVELELAALLSDDSRALVARHVPDPDQELLARIEALAGGNPFAVGELARRAAEEPAWVSALDAGVIGGIPSTARELLQRVAVVGTNFDTDEFVALSGMAEAEAYDHLDAALAARVIEPVAAGYRFRHNLVRDALLADVPPHRRRRIHRDAAARLEALGAPSAQVGHHLLAADETTAASRHLLVAAESAAAVGAYRDALDLIEPVRAHVSGQQRSRLLALRADLLLAIGDPGVIGAYREALEGTRAGDQRLLRARLARAAVMAGDLETAAAALDGVETDGGRDDGEILLAKGNLAYFTSDFDTATTVADEARRRVLAGDRTWQVLDLIALQGLLAHRRGEWFDRIGTELRLTSAVPDVANAVFDGYLCPAEYLLYGPTPYHDVIEMARQLRATAERSGALRAAAFAAALIGEAALLSGDLDVAGRELQDAVDLHHDLGSAAGEAHSLQRLAEVYVAKGDRPTAVELLHRAVSLARWSMIAMHLLQRIFGTMIIAAPDPIAARATVDRAESTLGTDDSCAFCSVMLAVPAAIACTEVGDVEHARRHLAVAERSAELWDGTSWAAATLEARAHLARAESDAARADELLGQAAELFARAGQPLDAQRCRSTAVAIR
jgi:DNA-binding SARP family transcriptional activator/tetratricopeptide (TPR) repeat protein